MKHFLLLLFLAQATAATLPTGSQLQLRLLTEIASYSSKNGAEVRATLIAPITLADHTVLPAGSTLRGSLADVKKIGWGLRHIRASLRINFHRIELPDASSLPISARVTAIDNARESVDATGKIVGIRATTPMGHRLAGVTRNVFIWDPLLQFVLAGSTAAVLRFPEAEIHFPTGTELHVALTAPLEIDTTWSTPLPRLPADPQSRAHLLALAKTLTPRTTTAGDHPKPADVVNLLFLGEPEWLERAFAAAGWLEAHPLSFSSGWRTFRSVAESKPYPQAPMSAMLLDENPPLFEFSKALNNYSRRHHLRVFPQLETFNNRAVLAAASTQDQAITFSLSQFRLLHLIDRNIDNERAKIVNDLAFTGCLDSAELIARPWLESTVRLSTGQTASTDGALAVLELNPCRTPLRTLPQGPPLRTRGGKLQRIGRQITLTLATDFTFNNPVYLAVKGVKWLAAKRSPKESNPDALRLRSR